MYIQSKKTQYSTFHNLCSNLRDSLNTNNIIRGTQGKLILYTLNDIIDLYGLEYDEAVEYLRKFIKNNLWEHYHTIVLTFYTKTKTSYQ